MKKIRLGILQRHKITVRNGYADRAPQGRSKLSSSNGHVVCKLEQDWAPPGMRSAMRSLCCMAERACAVARVAADYKSNLCLVLTRSHCYPTSRPCQVSSQEDTSQSEAIACLRLGVDLP